MSGTALQAGGSLSREKLYIERAADRDLYATLSRCEFCRVLAPRQIGKSSLRARCAARLQAEGYLVVQSDITTFGAFGGVEEEWYFSLFCEICLQVARDIDTWALWSGLPGHPPSRRFITLLGQQVLTRTEDPLILFLDEIDVAFTLSFASELFRSLRALHDHRVIEPVWERFALCLIGVASLSEFGGDPTLTPFNVGTEIRLEDFSRDELNGFRPELLSIATEAECSEILDEVFRHTSGHPYMTQVVLVRYVEDHRGNRRTTVGEIVQAVFIDTGLYGNVNVQTARRYLLEEPNADLKQAMLLVLKQICTQGSIPWGSHDRAQIRLLLAGIIARVRHDAHGLPFGPRERHIVDQLGYRNAIFKGIFGDAFLDVYIGKRAFREKFVRWREHRAPGMLLEGEELRRTYEWSAGRDVALIPEEVEYLTASLQEEARRAAERVDRALQESRSAKVSSIESRRTAKVARRFTLLLFVALLALSAISFYVQTINESELKQKRRELIEQEEVNKLIYEASKSVENDARRVTRRNELLAKMHISALSRDLLRGALTILNVDQTVNELEQDNEPADNVAELRENIDRAADLYLSSLLPVLEVHGHTSPLTGAHIKGRQVITTSEDGEARVHDLDTGRVRRFMVDNSQILSGIVGKPEDGRPLLWLGARSGRIARWDLRAGSDQKPLMIHSLATLRHVAVSDDGRRLLAVYGDRSAGVLDSEAGAVLRKLSDIYIADFVDAAGDSVVEFTDTWKVRVCPVKAKTAACRKADQSPTTSIVPEQISVRKARSGAEVLVVNLDEGAQVWKIEERRAPRLLGAVASNGAPLDRGKDGGSSKALIMSSGFCDDGKSAPRVILGLTDNTVRVWSIGEGTRVPTSSAGSPLFPSSDALAAVRCDDDGENFLYARTNGVINICPIDLSTSSRCKPFLISAPGLSLTGAEFVDLPEGLGAPAPGILASYTNGSARLYPITAPRAFQERQFLGRLPGGVWMVRAFEGRGKTPHLAAGSDGGMIQLWAQKDGVYAPRARCERAHRDEIWSLEVSSDGRWLLSASLDSTVNVWSIDDLDRGLCGSATRLRHDSPVRAARFVNSGTQVFAVTADSDGHLFARELQHDGVGQKTTLRDASCPVSPGCAIRHLEVLGTSVVAGLPGGQVDVVSIHGGEPTSIEGDPGEPGVIAELAIQPADQTAVAADRIVATATDRGVVRIFFAGGTELGANIRLGGPEVFGTPKLAFDPGGRWLLTSFAGKIRGIDLQGTPRLVDVGWEGVENVEIHDLQFSPTTTGTSSRLAAAASDGVVRLWDFDAAAGRLRPVHSAIRHEGPVYTARFVTSLGGAESLITGAGDGTVKLWEVAPEKLETSRAGQLRARTKICLVNGELGLRTGEGMESCLPWKVEPPLLRAVEPSQFVDRWWGAAKPTREPPAPKSPERCGKDIANQWDSIGRAVSGLKAVEQETCILRAADAWATHLRSVYRAQPVNRGDDPQELVGSLHVAWSMWKLSGARLSEPLQEKYACALSSRLIQERYMSPEILKAFVAAWSATIAREFRIMFVPINGARGPAWDRACSDIMKGSTSPR